jgi:hypothetical protein
LIIFSTWLTRLADTKVNSVFFREDPAQHANTGLSLFGFCLAVISGQLHTFALDRVVYNFSLQHKFN